MSDMGSMGFSSRSREQSRLKGSRLNSSEQRDVNINYWKTSTENALDADNTGLRKIQMKF